MMKVMMMMMINNNNNSNNYNKFKTVRTFCDFKLYFGVILCNCYFCT